MKQTLLDLFHIIFNSKVALNKICFSRLSYTKNNPQTNRKEQTKSQKPKSTETLCCKSTLANVCVKI